jgi:hypothetical protein
MIRSDPQLIETANIVPNKPAPRFRSGAVLDLLTGRMDLVSFRVILCAMNTGPTEVLNGEKMIQKRVRP